MLRSARSSTAVGDCVVGRHAAYSRAVRIPDSHPNHTFRANNIVAQNMINNVRPEKENMKPKLRLNLGAMLLMLHSRHVITMPKKTT